MHDNKIQLKCIIVLVTINVLQLASYNNREQIYAYNIYIHIYVVYRTYLCMCVGRTIAHAYACNCLRVLLPEGLSCLHILSNRWYVCPLVAPPAAV